MSYLERYGIPNTSYMNVSEPVSSAGGAFVGAPVGATGGSGGFNWGQAGGLLNLANMGFGMMGMRNTNRSFEQMQQTGGLMRDIDFDTNLFAQNKDIFEQKDAPRWSAKFQVNDPNFRQYEMRQRIMNPGLAGRYSAFVA